MYKNENKNLIPLYYYFYTGNEEICIGSKEYVEEMECYPDGPNGENGIVDEDFDDEPYSYYSEVYEAMTDIGCCETSEDIYHLMNQPIQDVIQKMRQKGFEMIYDPEEM